MPKLNSRKPMLASELGAGVPPLVEQVTEQPGITVRIDTDGARGSAVLVDAVHYQRLVEKAKNADVSPEKPFSIVGSIEILVSDEELEQGIAARRREQAALAAAKFGDL
jgi:hypothetical protein